LALNAFSTVGSGTYGFNAPVDTNYYPPSDSIPIDNSICPLFPNISRTPGSFDGYAYQTGLDGMLWALRVDSTITPDADLIQATTTNPIQA